jgi:hypothetical protein
MGDTMHYDKDRGDRVTDQFINELSSLMIVSGKTHDFSRGSSQFNEKDSHELLRHLTYFE